MILDPEPQDVRRELLAYIANVLPGAERDEFDRRLLEDEVFSQKVDAAEFLLIEEFADGTLAPAEHALVARWVNGSPQRLEQAAITAALRYKGKASAPERPRRHPARAWLWVVAAAACLAVVAASPMLHRKKVALPVTAELRPEPQLQLLQHQPPDTILLEAQRLRGGGNEGQSRSYSLHSDRPTRFQIILPKEAAQATYNVELRLAGTHTTPALLRFDGLTTKETHGLPYVEFSVPRGSLARNSYTLDLRSPRGDYVLNFSTLLVN